MTSEDVIHSFYSRLSSSRMLCRAASVTEWFRPTKTGVYHLFCAQFLRRGTIPL